MFKYFKFKFFFSLCHFASQYFTTIYSYIDTQLFVFSTLNSNNNCLILGTYCRKFLCFSMISCKNRYLASFAGNFKIISFLFWVYFENIYTLNHFHFYMSNMYRLNNDKLNFWMQTSRRISNNSNQAAKSMTKKFRRKYQIIHDAHSQWRL